jgi:RNA polymerase sigma-70 factor (ECF subfamily)
MSNPAFTETTPPAASSTDMEALAPLVREMRNNFTMLMDAHRPALWRYCLRLTGSPWDAEDLVQDTLLKAFGQLAKFYQPIDARGYLFRIASNAWIDTLRRARRGPDVLDTENALELAALLPAAEALVDPSDVHAAMEVLVHRLPPRQRVVLLLADAFDFSAREIAEMLETTEGAVKAALHRARSTLTSMRAHEGDASAASGTAAVHPRGASDDASEDMPSPVLVERYLEAFNRRDPDAIAALLHEHCMVDIVGEAEEHGRETSRQSSLAEWAADQAPQTAERAWLFGRDVVLVFTRTAEAPRVLSWLIELRGSSDCILGQRQYYFCPELIAHAARALGVPYVGHGYRYVAP